MCSYRIREFLPQFRTLPVAGDGDVREPGAGLVPAERVGEGAPVAAQVLEGEHRRRPRLAVAAWTQLDRARGSFEPLDDPRQLAGRPGAEKDERDVQVLARDDPHVGAGEGLA